MSTSDSLMRQMALGQAIRNQRELLQVSQTELARKSGVHVTSLNKIEMGTMNVSLETIYRIASALKLKTSELLAKAGL